MDEKDLIKRVRNSFKAKKSRAEILKGFQERGYKLAYAEEIINKAKRPREIFWVSLISIVFIFAIGVLFYANSVGGKKIELSNPLLNFIIAKNIAHKDNQTTKNLSNKGISITTKTYDNINITPEIVSYLLNEMGVWKLHKNPLTLENPIINIKIGNETFYSEIGDKIETKRGQSKSADLLLIINKQDLIDAVLSDSPESVIKKSVSVGDTKIVDKSSEAQLFAKGYLNLYNSLKN